MTTGTTNMRRIKYVNKPGMFGSAVTCRDMTSCGPLTFPPETKMFPAPVEVAENFVDPPPYGVQMPPPPVVVRIWVPEYLPDAYAAAAEAMNCANHSG